MPLPPALFIALSAAAPPAPGAPGMDPLQRDSECLVALRAEPGAREAAPDAERFFEARLSRAAAPRAVEDLLASAQQTILPNRNRHEIAANCASLYQILKLQADGGSAPQSGWRTISFPDGGELRYLPPRIRDADYPAEARAAGAEGTSMIRLTVGTDGRITSCQTAKSAGFAALDAGACRLYVGSARFELRRISQPLVLHAPVVWRLED